LSQFGCRKRSPLQTARHPATNEYHGVKAVDDYLWLEKTGDPAVTKWTEQQNKHARGVLDKLAARADVENRLEQLYESASADYSSLYSRSGQVFALKFKPPKQQAFLVRLASPNDLKSER